MTLRCPPTDAEARDEQSRLTAVVPGLYRGEREAQEIIERNMRGNLSLFGYVATSLTRLT